MCCKVRLVPVCANALAPQHKLLRQLTTTAKSQISQCLFFFVHHTDTRRNKAPMAPENLLLQIFKRRLRSTKLRRTAHDTTSNDAPVVAEPIGTFARRASSSHPPNVQNTLNVGVSAKTEAQQSTKRDTNSSSPSCRSSCSSDTETVSSIPRTDAPQTPCPAISMRDLFHAVIKEAIAATTLHINTLNTTLALLDSLRGFSATIDVLRREMQEKKRECEGMSKELLVFEELVAEMGLVK